ncbi:MAG: M42 family metallopeptidase [Bacillota bacterium]
MDARQLLKALSEAAGVSGFEQELEPLLREAFEPLVDEVRTDVLGSFIARKDGSGPPPRPSVMLAAHLDEIGMMVTKIDEQGFLRLTRVGGMDKRILPGMEVMVHGRRPLAGIIGTKPPHLLEPGESAKALKIEDLFVDVGLDRERAQEAIAIGDLVTFHRPYIELANGLVSGKSLDDRCGVVAMYICLEWLKRLQVQADVYAVATAQEEIGGKGAIVSTYDIVPDVGIAIDVGHGDSPGVPEDHTSPLDKGPALAIGPNIHPKIHELLQKAAKDAGVPVSTEVVPGNSGTDAWNMQVSRSGVPTGLVSIPLRYMHTSVETLSFSDLERAGKLLAFFIATVDRSFVEGLTWS